MWPLKYVSHDGFGSLLLLFLLSNHDLLKAKCSLGTGAIQKDTNNFFFFSWLFLQNFPPSK